MSDTGDIIDAVRDVVPEIRDVEQAVYKAVDAIENRGVTLRDRFAMAALTGLLVNRNDSVIQGLWDNAASAAYQIADSMLKARKEGGA